MKLFLVALCVAVCSAAKLDNTYLPPGNARTAGGSGSFLAAPRGGAGFGGGSGFGGKTTFGGGAAFGSKSSFSSGSFGGAANRPFPAAPAAPAQSYGAPGGGNYRSGGSHSAGPQIPILRFNNENNGDGTYRFEYETGNGIQAQEAGQQKPGGQEDINDVHGSFAYTGDDGQNYAVSYVADENGFQPQGAHLPTPPPIPEEILKSLQQNAAEEARGIVDDGSYNGGSHGGAGGYGSAGGYGGAGGRGGAGGHSGAGGHGGAGGFGGRGGFGGASRGGAGGAFGGAFGGKSSGGFGNAAASRQYLAPNKPSFNANTGYNY